MSPLLPLTLGCLLAADPSTRPEPQVAISVAVGPAGLGNVTMTAAGRRLKAESILHAFRTTLKSPPPAFHHTNEFFVCSAANVPMVDVGPPGGDGQLNLTSLFAELRAQGVGRIHVSVILPGADAVCELASRALPSQPHPGTATYSVFQADVPTDSVDPVLIFGFDVVEVPELSPFNFDFFSKTPGDPAWLWLLSIVPLGTAGFAWRVRRLAARPNLDPVAVGFRYWRFQSLLPVGVVTAWLGAMAVSGAARHMDLWLSDPGTAARAARWVLLYFLPPSAVILLALAITAPAVRRLGELGWPLANTLRRTAAVPIVSYGALLLVILGGVALGEGSLRVGVALVLVALTILVLVNRRTRSALQLTPIPLTHGELRDRVAELASFFRVRVPQVGLLPSDRSRMVNAFAMRGQGVWLSDRLVTGLGRREVDAIVAHELAHLRQFARRPRRGTVGPMGWAVWLVVTVVLTVIMSAQSFGALGLSLRPGPGWPPVDWPPLALAGLVLSLQLSAKRESRRREFDADRGSVEATGDAASLITALTRLNKLNGLPDGWGRWDGLFLTHPPTNRRVAALARLGHLSPEQFAASRALAKSEPDTYAIPPSAVDGATVFSPQFRRRVLARLSWLALGAAILPPLLAVVIADAVGPGPTADAILIAGAVLPMAIYVAAVNRLAPAGGSVLERGVRAKLAAEGLDLGGAEYVSLAPASTTRIYDGFSQWDVGLLWLAGDRLSFVGEHARFALTAEAVVGIRIGRGLPGWLPTRRVYITWRDPVTDAGGTFAVWPGAARSTLRLRIATKAFADRLRGWQAGERTAQPPMALADLGPPAFGTVHGVSPADVVPFRAWLKSFLLLGPLTAGLCLLAGVPFDLTVLSGGGYVLAVTAAALAAQALPYWLAREREAYEEPEYVVEVAESSGTASRD